MANCSPYKALAQLRASDAMLTGSHMSEPECTDPAFSFTPQTSNPRRRDIGPLPPYYRYVYEYRARLFAVGR